MSESVIFSSTTNMKRGRGRPSKAGTSVVKILESVDQLAKKARGRPPKAKTSKSIPDIPVVETSLPSDAVIASSTNNSNIAMTESGGGIPPKTSGTTSNKDITTGTNDDTVTNEDNILNKESTIATCKGKDSTMVKSIESATVNIDVEKDISDVYSGTGDLVQSAVEGLDLETDCVNQQDDDMRDFFELAIGDGDGSGPSSASEPNHQEFRGFDLSKNLDVSASLQTLTDSQTLLTTCEICGESMPNRQSLEEHREMAGHFKCMAPDCSYGNCSADDLVTHLSKDHGNLSAYLITDVPAVIGDMPSVNDVINFVVTASSPKTSYPGLDRPQKHTGAEERESTPSTLPTPHQQQVVEQRGFETVIPPLTTAATKRPSKTVSEPENILRRQPVATTPISSRNGPATRNVHAFGTPPKQAQPSECGNSIKVQQQNATQKYVIVMNGSDKSPGQIQHSPTKSVVISQPPQQRSLIQVPMTRRNIFPGIMRVERGGKAPVVRAEKRMAISTQAASRGSQTAKKRFVNSTPISQCKGNPGGNSQSKTTVNILAKRGVLVTPSSVAPTRPQPVTSTEPARSQPIRAQSVTTVNLTSVSITPTMANNIHPQMQAAVLGGCVRSPLSGPTSFEQHSTIDLTVEDDECSMSVSPSPKSNPSPTQKSSPAADQRETPTKSECYICDKVFSHPGALALHVMSHVDNTVGNNLAFKCNVCAARYAMKGALTRHMNIYHKKHAGGGSKETNPLPASSSESEQELVVPLVDLRQCGGPAGLRALGIHHYIRMSNLGIQSNKIMSIDTA